MTVLAAIAFAAFLLEDNHLVTLYEGCEDFTYYLCAFHCGCANLHFSVSVSEEHAVKFDLLSFFNCFAEIVYIQELVFFSFELLSLNFYDTVSEMRVARLAE